MINYEFIDKLNPSIVLKLINDKKLIKNDINKEFILQNYLRTKRYEDIKNFIKDFNLDQKIKKYIIEQIDLSNINSKNYIKNLNESLKNFYNDSKRWKNDLIEKKYSKSYILEIQSFEKIFFSKNLFENMVELSLYLFNTNEIEECLNLLHILESINKFNVQIINIYWGLFYIYFLKDEFILAKNLLENKILPEIKKKSYNINYYISFVKYYLINEIYLNSGINYDFWLKLFELNGFSKAIELDNKVLLPHLIIIKLYKNEDLNKIKKIMNLKKIEISSNIMFKWLDNFFININLDYNILNEINLYLNSSIIYKEFKENILEPIKVYLFKHLNNILKEDNINNLAKLFLFDNNNDNFEKWIIDLSIKNDLKLNINNRENKINFEYKKEKENVKENKIYNKIINLVDKYNKLNN